MGKAIMETLPTRWSFLQSWPTKARVAFKPKLAKTLVYEISAQSNHSVMQIGWRGPARCIPMPGYQQIQRFVDMTSCFWFVSSLMSPQNVVQGNFVTFGPGAKKQMEQRNCMSFAPTGVYGKCWYVNTTNSCMMDFFAKLTHQCKSFIQGSWEKP